MPTHTNLAQPFANSLVATKLIITNNSNKPSALLGLGAFKTLKTSCQLD